jgi:hypothetical protein
MRGNAVFVHTKDVKNVTLSAEADLIERARLRAVSEKTTLNAAFPRMASKLRRRRDATQ